MSTSSQECCDHEFQMIPNSFDTPHCERCHKCDIERVEYVMSLLKHNQTIPHVHTWDGRGECIGVYRSTDGNFKLCGAKLESQQSRVFVPTISSVTVPVATKSCYTYSN